MTLSHSDLFETVLALATIVGAIAAATGTSEQVAELCGAALKQLPEEQATSMRGLVLADIAAQLRAMDGAARCR